MPTTQRKSRLPEPGKGRRTEKAPQFTRIQSPRSFDSIAAQIRDAVASGHLRVGQRLPPERELAEQFGVARNTLREALRSLEYAGLIRLRKGATGGAFVRENTGEAIITGLLDMYNLGAIEPWDLTEARIWVESVVVRVACERATEDDIAELKANVAAAREATESGDQATRGALNFEFHRILARATRNPVVIVMMNAMLEVLDRFVRTIGPYDNAFVVQWRRRFMEHFEARDADAAVAEMEKGLRRLQRSYLSKAGEKVPANAGDNPKQARRRSALPAVRKRDVGTAAS